MSPLNLRSSILKLTNEILIKYFFFYIICLIIKENMDLCKIKKIIDKPNKKKYNYQIL